MLQQTVKREVVFEGAGIHTGKPVRVIVKPAGVNYGIRFLRTDQGHREAVPARVEHIGQSALAGRQTTLGEGADQVVTIEHLMAAFHGLGIDNALVETNGGELPALDGSAREYVRTLSSAGVKGQDAERSYVSVSAPIYLENGHGISATILPSDEFKISYTLSYSGEDIGDQFVSFKVTPETFAEQIAPARTFCLRKEVERLKANGYGVGATYDNTLVFDHGKPMHTQLRFPEEAARHKVLDLIGDLYLAGYPLKAHVIAIRTGHSHNIELVRRLVMSPSSAVGEKRNQDSLPKVIAGELDLDEIKKIIPHRYPFLWVDRIIELVPGKRAVGIKNVTPNDYFFEGHFPGHPVMPGVLILEAMAQVGAVAMMCQPENKHRIAYFMSIDEAKFRKPVLPGSQLRMEIEILKTKARIGQCRGVATVNGEVVCDAQVKFAFVKEGNQTNGGESNGEG